MSSKNTESCPVSCGSDRLSCLLGKVGVSRSLLVTLALLPFALGGVSVIKDVVVFAWNFVSGTFSSIGS